MTMEVLIFPAVRSVVAKASRWAAALALGCAAAALADLALAPLGALEYALLFGGLSELFMSMLQPLTLWVGLWCHMVLLAGRGMELTRYGLLVAAVLSLLMPVCTTYSLVEGQPLLLRQADLPLICDFIFLVCVLLNVNRGVAVGWRMLTLLVLFAVAMLLYALTNVAPLVWFCNVCKLIGCAAIWWPLRALSRYALRVVSVPEPC